MINWQPIDTAPKDNKRPLFLGRFNEAGELTEMDFNASWEQERESREIPELYWIWMSEHGRVEDPTHWAYMDADPLPVVSDTTAALIDLLRQRDAAGRAKYGATLDRTDLTHAQWLQHMVEELLDGAGYALAALRESEARSVPAESESDFLIRTNREYVEWCAKNYKPEYLDANGHVSANGLWAWQAARRLAKDSP